MISLSKDFENFHHSDPAFMHILCLKAAFSGSVLEEDSWVQFEDSEISSVIARHGGRLYLSCRNIATEEIKSFTQLIGYGEVFCRKSTAEALGLSITDEFAVLSAKGLGKGFDTSPEIGLKALYDRLSLGKDGGISLPAFEDFAPDLSHRLRHGGAKVILSENGTALVFLCEKGGIINGISVKKELRRRGEGSKILELIKDAADGEIFVCCDKKIKDFYIKNGFTERETAVIAR